ncbi:HD domain-containing protein [Enterocloster bolteae]|jgi:CRISPR/Cas system-associated endonuclease Cas3-HD|uniref:HD domain-containing protein n=1 Tax=Enterocloster bolteae TaxID=208479 RepID=UPI00210EE426|nr:HD domain-containing protein [Enterocloster bolteae]MCQ4754662.1 HD domain-containing protein [Enterocloster bolteae]
MSVIEKVLQKMIEFDEGDAKRIQHFTKVYCYAHLIAVEEGLDEQTMQILDLASIVHDIGILPAEEKYGYHNGKIQEQIGPAYAGELLREFDIDEEIVKRVEFLVGHHHTYQGVDSIDWQILLEADFLVNSFEKNMSQKAIMDTVQNVFQTKSGVRLCKLMYRLPDEMEA